ncbi:uncharacterized protein EV154DRAFT_557666 [Mucor mucedo]|uniref:uncharacterized protein n=1 Tax=Mucor mucedo TaxID=29922 RepID=UPI00221F753C|nr:uncharacterized protein EV154DRAFT_557666 [Mucor mucedo]KAI7897358.1 hypothetical protein EV154DRAFT_557666 [Mucor mucedo]
MPPTPSQAQPTYTLVNNFEVVGPLKEYINYCKQNSERKGFFVKSETHHLLASKSIILPRTKTKEYESKAVVDDSIHAELTKLTRGVDGKSNRFTLKKELAKMYGKVTEDDQIILDIYFNCLNKLSNFKKTEEISEMELTTNYVDPVLSPKFHSPENNKHLIWLNRKEDNTEHLRPDAMMKRFHRKLFGTTLGYCEVKPPDAQKDVDSLCTDLIRLAILSRKLMLRKANHVVCSLQAVGKKFNIRNFPRHNHHE